MLKVSFYRKSIFSRLFCFLVIGFKMNLLLNELIIDLTLSTPDTGTSFADDAKTSSLIKTKIGPKGLEKYFENFKKYITGDNKGKISTTRILCKEIVWHLKYATSNYNRHLQRKHEVEFDLSSKQVYKNKKRKQNETKFYRREFGFILWIRKI